MPEGMEWSSDKDNDSSLTTLKEDISWKPAIQNVMDNFTKKFKNPNRFQEMKKTKEQTTAQTTELKQEVMPEFSSEVKSIVTEIQNTKIDYEPEWRSFWKKILIAFKEKNWGALFDGICGLFSTLLWWKSLTKTKKWWNSDWNNWKWKESQFSEKDIDGLVELCKKEPEIGKKNMYARLIARRKDAEFQWTMLSEPEKTIQLLQFHAENKWIQVGDVINFAGNSKNISWNSKEASIQTIVGSDRTHSAIITRINPLEITHASSKWVNTMHLIDYMNDYKDITYSIVQWWWQSSADYAESQVWKKYDAVNWVKEMFGDDSQQFCSELTIRALWDSWKLPKDLKTLEKHGEVFPHHLFSLSYPKYVNEFPIEETTKTNEQI